MLLSWSIIHYQIVHCSLSSSSLLAKLSSLCSPEVLGINDMYMLTKNLNGIRYSTAFSGVDAPGVALHVSLLQLRERLLSLTSPDAQRVGPLDAMKSPEHVLAIEWLHASQKELLNMPLPLRPKCMFCDISALWKGVS